MRTLRHAVLSGIMVLTAVACVGCSKKKEDGDLVKAKKGHLPVNEKITVGEALDGYKYFGKKEWLLEKTPKDAKFLILKADMSPEYIKEVNDVCGKSDKQAKKIESQKWSIQLTVTGDDKLSISGTQTLTIFADETKRVGSLNEALMKSVYNNELATVCK